MRKRRNRRKKNVPSIRGILSQDYYATTGFILAFILSAVCIASLSVAGKINPALVKYAPWIIIIGFSTAYWRICKITRTFKDGERVTATLLSKYYHNNGVNLEYSYRFGSRTYHRKYGAMGCRYISGLDIGDETEVIVDPKLPDQGLLADIYFI